MGSGDVYYLINKEFTYRIPNKSKNILYVISFCWSLLLWRY